MSKTMWSLIPLCGLFMPVVLFEQAAAGASPPCGRVAIANAHSGLFGLGDGSRG
jgi:hypothetical protein